MKTTDHISKLQGLQVPNTLSLTDISEKEWNIIKWTIMPLVFLCCPRPFEMKGQDVTQVGINGSQSSFSPLYFSLPATKPLLSFSLSRVSSPGFLNPAKERKKERSCLFKMVSPCESGFILCHDLFRSSTDLIF